MRYTVAELDAMPVGTVLRPKYVRTRTKWEKIGPVSTAGEWEGSGGGYAPGLYSSATIAGKDFTIPPDALAQYEVTEVKDDVD